LAVNPIKIYWKFGFRNRAVNNVLTFGVSPQQNKRPSRIKAKVVLYDVILLMFLKSILPSAPFEVISKGATTLLAFPLPRYPRPESLHPWVNKQLFFVIAKKLSLGFNK
jgi:hypothetical protein